VLGEIYKSCNREKGKKLMCRKYVFVYFMVNFLGEKENWTAIVSRESLQNLILAFYVRRINGFCGLSIPILIERKAAINK